MNAIYVAQHRMLSENACDLIGASAGLYLIKIGKSRDLADRARTINGDDENRDWRYAGIAGWRMIRFSEVLSDELDQLEKDSFARFADYKLSWGDRTKLVNNEPTGFELFLGGRAMLDAIRTEFTQPAVGAIQLSDVQQFCAADFHSTSKPIWNRSPTQHRPAPGQSTLNRIRANLNR